MYFCYIDESGTSAIPGTSSHFIFVGLAIHHLNWKNCETAINQIKLKYELGNAEIHTGWLLRPYIEQTLIPNFDTMNYQQRRLAVQSSRNAKLLHLQRSHLTNKQFKQKKKNYRQTSSYIHLTLQERRNFVKEIAKQIGNWSFVRLFAECIDKINFPLSRYQTIDEQAFEQIVSRFEKFLKNYDDYGVLIYDNNITIAKKHTELMKSFHKKGTMWSKIEHIIETPLFVSSELTSMIQIADVCAYSIRRYCENQERELFDEIFKRVDRVGSVTVGSRHFTKLDCNCLICQTHTFPTAQLTDSPPAP